MPVLIGILDSGINPQMIRSPVLGWKDFISGLASPYDEAAHHGSTVATYAEGTVERIAPGTDLGFVVGKVCSGSACQLSTLMQGLQWMASQGVAAVNVSMGANLPMPTPAGASYLIGGFHNLYHTGALPVVSGGNGVDDLGAVPMYAPLTAVNNAFAISAGWPVLGGGYYTDMVEDSCCGSSFSAPQIAAKGALLNAGIRNPDLVWEALMMTSAPWPTQSDPLIDGRPWYLDPQGIAAYCNTPNLSTVERGVCMTLLNQHAPCCAVPGNCGWGFPRFDAASSYVAARQQPDWFHAGLVPGPVADPRWAAWSPGYIARIAQATPKPNLPLRPPGPGTGG